MLLSTNANGGTKWRSWLSYCATDRKTNVFYRWCRVNLSLS